MYAQPEFWHYPYGRGFTRDETERSLHLHLEHWELLGFGCWVARYEGRVAGYVGLSVPTFLEEILPAVEVGWRFAPEYWGRGLAREGAIAALEEGFGTLGLEWICSLPAVDNLRSVRVAERLGLRRTREVDLPANDRRPVVIAAVFELTAREWRTNPAEPAHPG